MIKTEKMLNLEYKNEIEPLSLLVFYFKLAVSDPDFFYQMFNNYKTDEEQEEAINKIISGFKELQKIKSIKKHFNNKSIEELNDKLTELVEFNDWDLK